MPLALLLVAGWWPFVMRDHLDLILLNSAISTGEGAATAVPGSVSALPLGDTLAHTFASYWGMFGWGAGLMLPQWLLWVIAVSPVLALLGVGLAAARGGWKRLGDGTRLGLVLLAAYLGWSVAVLLVRYQRMPLPGVSDGRFLYHAIPAAGVLTIWGLSRLPGRLALATPLSVAPLALGALVVPFTVCANVFPPPVPGWAIFDQTTVERRVDLSFANGVTFLGYTPSASEVHPGDELTFKLTGGSTRMCRRRCLRRTGWSIRRERFR